MKNFHFLFCLDYSEGTKCGCAQWCNEHGSRFGVCGSGHTCICKPHPIEKHTVGKSNSNLIKLILSIVLF